MQFFGGSEISPAPPVATASGNKAHMIYVFNRNGVCLLYREWNRAIRILDSNQDHKLMFGLLFLLNPSPPKWIHRVGIKGILECLNYEDKGVHFIAFDFDFDGGRLRFQP